MLPKFGQILGENMAVIKFNPNESVERWDSIPRSTLQDTSISSSAHHLLMFLLSKSTSWQVSNAQIQKQFTWGKTKVGKVLKELKDSGYLSAGQARSGGQFNGIEYIVHPIKQEIDSEMLNPSNTVVSPRPLYGDTVNGDTVNGDTVKRPLQDNRVYEDNRVNENRDLEIKNTKSLKTRFIAPTIVECENYFFGEKKITDLTMPSQFWDYYQSNGWMVGRAKMKDWRAAANGWISRHGKFNRNGQGYQKQQRPKPVVQQIADRLRAEEQEFNSEMMGIGYEK